MKPPFYTIVFRAGGQCPEGNFFGPIVNIVFGEEEKEEEGGGARSAPATAWRLTPAAGHGFHTPGGALDLGSSSPLDAADRELLTPWVVVIVVTVFLFGFSRRADELFEDMGLEAYYTDEDLYITRGSPASSKSAERMSSRRRSDGGPDVEEDLGPTRRSPASLRSRRRHRTAGGHHRQRRSSLSPQAVRSIASRHKPKIAPRPPDDPGRQT
ncbi:uncharacterized protein LOC144095197 [Amblyomma americanum]